MPITDIITAICFLFLVWKGASRGFLGSLLGPLALILATIISIVYYAYTKNALPTLCIGLIGPFVLSWLFRSVLHSLNPENNLSFISRLSGALLSLCWGMSILIMTIVLITIIPPMHSVMQSIDKDIYASKVYQAIKPFNPFAVAKTDPQVNIKYLSQDPRIQAIINDPQIIDAVNRKDYAAMISNPKITALMQDPEMIKKMMAIYQKQQAGSSVN